ncbi:MAG: DUF547 domain-containing protein [Acetobacterales bacterium]
MFHRAVAAACTVAWLLAGAPSQAAPAAELWERWTAHDARSDARIEHETWGGFLRRYVHVDPYGANRVDYGGVAAADRLALKDYVRRLGEIPISRHSRPEQLAYWINLYNALTVDVVLDHYPVGSIRDIDISPGFFSDGPWGKKLVTIEGEPVSLDDIEHRILRPIWQDPRIHYAVNCASIGCPDLQPEPFTAGTADAMLTAAAQGYVNDPRGVLVADGRASASSIYDWFQADFGGGEDGVLAHLRRYADDGLRERLEGIASIGRYRYDWSLNDVSR